MQPKRTSIWSHDSNETASGKPGTLHIPHHAFGRIFERDLRPPIEVAKAIVNRRFLDTVLKLHALGDPDGCANAFTLRFLGGFLTGTVREFKAGHEVTDTKILDVRTFLHANDKPEWVAMTTDKPYAFFQYADRRSKNAAIDQLSESLDASSEVVQPFLNPPMLKELPSGA